MVWGNNGASHRDSICGHNADVEQRATKDEKCRVSKWLPIDCQTRPSSRHGKDTAIKSRAKEVGSSRAMRRRTNGRPKNLFNAEKSLLRKMHNAKRVVGEKNLSAVQTIAVGSRHTVLKFKQMRCSKVISNASRRELAMLFAGRRRVGARAG